MIIIGAIFIALIAFCVGIGFCICLMAVTQEGLEDMNREL